ncbi:hypothetical protein B0H19DRAFT_1185508 [Mycena capillaripes]|nr:hypothetical protein B0H19DRAFT_1185508 [Mycena capillaripes]
MAPLTPLPLDLLHPILSHITEKKTLLALCHTSKSFLHEAQSRLFADVELQCTAVALFCHTISASSALAKSVVRLSIQLADDFTEMDALSHALHSLCNLRALEIVRPQPCSWADVVYGSLDTPWPHGTAARILHDCPFRLRVFGSAFMMAEADFFTFLGQQPEIKELASFDMSGDVVTLAPGILPQLKTFKSGVPRLKFEAGLEALGTVNERIIHEKRMDILMRRRR